MNIEDIEGMENEADQLACFWYEKGFNAAIDAIKKFTREAGNDDVGRKFTAFYQAMKEAQEKNEHE